MEPVPDATSVLHDFLDFLYGGLNGYAYLAHRDPKNPEDWKQEFFTVPTDISRMENVITQRTSEREVYVSPAVYKEPSATKESFKASNVVWTEFDGNAPDDYEIEPSLKIQTSSDENQHVYWQLSEPVTNVDTLEQINRNITYAMAADLSAWDATQVLRPPGTRNHKRGTQTKLLGYSNTSWHQENFNVLPQAPTEIDTTGWQLGALPNVEDVVLRYPFPPDAIRLLQKTKDEISHGDGQRARSLVNLAHTCCEMGMSDAEVFVVLRLADDRWEKFKGRKDRNKRLSHIITVARHKHPYEQEDEEPFTFAFDFVSFLETEIEIDWVIEPMLYENGMMLMVGPSGIGKTQITLQLMIHLALGRNYMHYKIERPRKVMFLSLEMDHGSLKFFLEQMNKSLSMPDRELLRKNFLVIPHGEPWPFNLPVGQTQLEPFLEEFQPEGLFVDSIGSTIKGSLSQDEAVLDMLEFNDHIRKKYGCFTWYIHHMRKASNGGHAPTSQDDIYGNQYLLNRASSSYGILRGPKGLIRVRNFKNRLHETENDYFIKRSENLTFVKSEEQPTKNDKVEVIEFKKPDEDKGPPVGEGGFSL